MLKTSPRFGLFFEKRTVLFVPNMFCCHFLFVFRSCSFFYLHLFFIFLFESYNNSTRFIWPQLKENLEKIVWGVQSHEKVQVQNGSIFCSFQWFPVFWPMFKHVSFSQKGMAVFFPKVKTIHNDHCVFFSKSNQCGPFWERQLFHQTQSSLLGVQCLGFNQD